MAYNDKKIVSVLIEECDDIEERCKGYRSELKSLLADVLKLEREHAISKLNITQKIGDQVNTVGMFLHRNHTTNS